jgi:hypothetical protein
LIAKLGPTRGEREFSTNRERIPDRVPGPTLFGVASLTRASGRTTTIAPEGNEPLPGRRTRAIARCQRPDRLGTRWNKNSGMLRTANIKGRQKPGT